MIAKLESYWLYYIIVLDVVQPGFIFFTTIHLAPFFVHLIVSSNRIFSCGPELSTSVHHDVDTHSAPVATELLYYVNSLSREFLTLEKKFVSISRTLD